MNRSKCGYTKCYFSPKIIITATKNEYIFTKNAVQEWTINKTNNNRDKFLFFIFFEPDKDWPWSYVFQK